MEVVQSVEKPRYRKKKKYTYSDSATASTVHVVISQKKN